MLPVSALPAFLADVSLRILVPAAVALVFIAAARPRAALRHALWTAVMLSMLAMPVMSVWLPPLPAAVLPSPSTLPFLFSAAVALPETSASGPAGRPITPNPAFDWMAAAGWLYLAISFALVARVLAGYAGVCRLVRGAAPTGIAALVRILESAAIRVPLTIGWLRPAVLLPPGWRDWDSSKLHAALSHEAEHVVRRDWLVAMLASLNKAVFWFHPLAWFLERRLARLAEEACDDRCLLELPDRNRYAQTLLDVAAALDGQKRRVFQGAAGMAHLSGLGRRVERILDPARRGAEGLRPRAWLAIAAACAVLTAAAAAVQLQPATPQAPPHAGPDPLMWKIGSMNNGEFKIAAEQVEPLEAQLRTNPEDRVARAKLMTYYYEHGPHGQLELHSSWFIENHPEDEYFAPWFLMVTNKQAPHYDEAAAGRARQLWLAQVNRHGEDARVLSNAAPVFASDDFGFAADLARRAYAADPGNERRLRAAATLFSTAVLASFEGDRFTGTSVPPADANRLRAEIESSTDAALLGTTGSNLMMQAMSWQDLLERAKRSGSSQVMIMSGMSGRSLRASEIPDRPGLVQAGEFGKILITRAKQLDPGSDRWRNMLENLTTGLRVTPSDAPPPAPPLPPPASGVNRIRVGAAIQATKLIESVAPEYPESARQARIQGVVRFTIVVGTGGEISHVVLISGHPILTPAAMEAIRRWRYSPTLLNGQPVEVVTQADVMFSLEGSQNR